MPLYKFHTLIGRDLTNANDDLMYPISVLTRRDTEGLGGLARIPSEGLDSAEDLRRHGNGALDPGAAAMGVVARGSGGGERRRGTLETRSGRIQAVDDVLLSEWS